MKTLEKNEKLWQTERHIHKKITNFLSADCFKVAHLV